MRGWTVFSGGGTLPGMVDPRYAIPLDEFVAAGFSGHGFKISPAVGRLVADLLLDGKSSDPDIPAADLRLSRFAEGDLLTSPFPYRGAGQMR